jgi:hypothetical protein
MLLHQECYLFIYGLFNNAASNLHSLRSIE